MMAFFFPQMITNENSPETLTKASEGQCVKML